MPNPNYANGYYSNGPVQYGAQTQPHPNFSIPMGQSTPMPAQPMPTTGQNPSMSIAAIRGGRLVAEQFPVAAGTELWLIDKEANKIYIKTNPMNPADMREADFVFIEPQVNQNTPVSREEFNELKGMITQLGAMITEHRGDQRGKGKNRDWKRGEQHDQSDGVSASAG